MTDITARLSTALADRYRIERHLGEGGMATVYLAEDLKHRRKVAVKVLRPELAAVLGAERFVQEITTTANLQHPHILPLFDSGEADSFLYYVMPYIEGETLRDKLNRETQLSIDEAVRITTEVADALDSAHQEGVIHRDIKPENILLHKGRPMVADFGIALAVSAAAGGRMTETGLSLGTPHYMSPEQATADKEITNRSDIYSLGTVLYEMLTGEPPHTGASAQAIVMKIVTDEARPVADLRKSVPPNVAASVAKALEKLPADRFASAGQFAEAMKDPYFAAPTASAPKGTRRPAVARLGWPAAAGVLAIVLAWMLLRPTPTSVEPVVRFTVDVPGGHMMQDGEVPHLTISPDGQTLAYIEHGMIMMRSLDRFEAVPLEGTEGAENLHFSPDGKWIGFVPGGFFGNFFKKVAVIGGPVLEVAQVDMAFDPGPTWSANGTIVWANNNAIPYGIWGIPADGGTPRRLTAVDTTLGESFHMWPELLDDGRRLLYTVVGHNGLWDDARIVIQDLDTGDRAVVRERGTFGRYVNPGFVIYAEATGTILAVPLDLRSMTVTGAPVAMESGVRVARWGGAASIAVAESGTATFIRGSNLANFRLVWFDRQGRELGQLGPPMTTNHFRLSRDGRRLATYINDERNPDVWVLDVATGDRDRLTFAEAWDWTPVWSRDDRQIAYSFSRTGGASIGIKEVETGADVRRIDTYASGIWLTDWSRDGRWLAFDRTSPGNRRDVVAMPLESTGDSALVIATAADECCARFSPDGRWMAYEADGEVYVTAFASLDTKRQISTGGGLRPIWSSDGDELFFWRDSTVMSARVIPGNRFAYETPRPLFTVSEATGMTESSPDYDVAPGGDRFLISVANPAAAAREIHVVVNWLERLKGENE